MTLLWLSRPLATVSIAWLSIADRKAYRDNAREVTIHDYIYGLANIYLFGSIAKITDTKPSRAPVRARLARGGSAVWFLAFILSLALVLTQGFVYSAVWVARRRRSLSSSTSSGSGSSADTDNDDEKSIMSRWYRHRLFVCPLFFLDVLRFVGSWLLWAGLLFTDETAFCPSRRTWARVTVIWLFVPFVDCLWRGFATFTKKRAGTREEEDDLISMT
jgi:hypothetical protein